MSDQNETTTAKRYPLGPNDRYTTAKVPIEVSPEERATLADENDKLTLEIEQNETAAKEAASAFRKKIKELKAKRRENVEARETGKKLVEAQCVERTDFPNGKTIWFPHPDAPNATKVAEMPLSADEMREPPLFSDGSDAEQDEDEKPKGAAGATGKRTKKPKGAAATTH